MTWIEFNTCKICGQKVDKNHTWGKHRKSEKDYFLENFHKLDLNTWQRLDFKSSESYYQNDFTDKRSMSKWLKNNPDKVVEWCVGWLKRRKEIKNLVYFPSEAELIGQQFPSLAALSKTFTCSRLRELVESYEHQLTVRYDYFTKIELDNEKKIVYYIDSRETDIYKIKDEKKIRCLNVGDYTIEDNQYNVYAERKSITDLIGSLTSGYERFRNEFVRAKDGEAYIIVLIDGKPEQLYSSQSLPWMKNSGIKPDYILYQMRRIMLEFPQNCQFIFTGGRKESVVLLNKIFRYKRNPKEIDWQFRVRLEKC